MSIVKKEVSKKWINAFVAIVAILIGYSSIVFINQLGEWFDLESKVQYFLGWTQGVGVVVGLGCFLYAVKSETIMKYLNEVYTELTKVVWPDNDSVVKVTIGIVIALSIVSSIFVSIDFGFRKLLALIY